MAISREPLLCKPKDLMLIIINQELNTALSGKAYTVDLPKALTAYLLNQRFTY